jgi:hypothetical protein
MIKLTKKQALTIIEEKWGNVTSDDYIEGICISIPKLLEKDSLLFFHIFIPSVFPYFLILIFNS